MLIPNKDLQALLASSDDLKTIYNAAHARWIWNMEQIWKRLTLEEIKNLKKNFSLDWCFIDETILDIADGYFDQKLDDKSMDEISEILSDSNAIWEAAYDAVYEYANENGWTKKN